LHYAFGETTANCRIERQQRAKARRERGKVHNTAADESTKAKRGKQQPRTLPVHQYHPATVPELWVEPGGFHFH